MEATHALLTASETWQDFCHVNVLWLFLTLLAAGGSGYLVSTNCVFPPALATLTAACEEYFTYFVLSVVPFAGSRSNNLVCLLRGVWLLLSGQ